MTRRLLLDFETRSDLDIKEVQNDLYVRHESTRALMVGWAIDDGPVTVTEGEVLPPEVLACLSDSTIQKIAWNATFEIAILRHRFGIEVNYTEWLDPMVWARYLTLPAKLEHCPAALGLTVLKDTKGGRLKGKFCSPTKSTSKMMASGAPPSYWRDKTTDPEDWELFKSYCGSDILAARETLKTLATYPAVPPSEWNLWRFDQMVNLAGIPIDMRYVENASALMAQSDQKTREFLTEMSGIKKLTSYAQIKVWLASQGYPMKSIAEPLVNEALVGEMPDLVRTFLTERQKLSGAGPKKLAAILLQVSPDHRLRHQFGFLGAGTGRWIGRGVQPHNMPKPDRSVEDRIEEITDAVRSGFLPPDLDCSVAITSTIRSSFRAPLDHHLVMVDYASIEPRILAWLSDCPALLAVFREGRDIYRATAAVFYGVPYDKVTPQMRSGIKPVVLGGGYGMGWDRLIDYAHSMGVELTEERAKEQTKSFRATYPEIPALWDTVERYALAAVGNRARYVMGHGLVFDGRDSRFLKIDLPAGRSLFYLKPSVAEVETKYGLRTRLSFEAPLITGHMAVVQTFGSSLVENLVQAIARDVLCTGLLRAHGAGYHVVLHVHDEIGTEEPINSPRNAAGLADLMSRPPRWAPDLLLGAKGHESAFYTK